MKRRGKTFIQSHTTVQKVNQISKSQTFAIDTTQSTGTFVRTVINLFDCVSGLYSDKKIVRITTGCESF